MQPFHERHHTVSGEAFHFSIRIGPFPLASSQNAGVDDRQLALTERQEYLRRIMRKHLSIAQPLGHQRLMDLFAKVVGMSDGDGPACQSEELSRAVSGIHLDQPTQITEVPFQ